MESYLKFFFSSPPLTGTRPAILCDRDGVINERIFGSYVTTWNEFQFRPGIKDALASMAELKLPIIVISNQAGVGKSLISPEALQDITERFVAELHERGARVDAVYYCPHTPEQHCGCRKPHPGLLEAAARDWRLDLRRSVLIGDSQSDMQAARSLDCRAILLPPRENLPKDRPASGAVGLEFQSVEHASDLGTEVRKLLGFRSPEKLKIENSP
jgi:D-glycero-D-manno-heptose 1,7-bisphosphate phosphatase